MVAVFEMTWLSTEVSRNRTAKSTIGGWPPSVPTSPSTMSASAPDWSRAVAIGSMKAMRTILCQLMAR